MNNKIFDECYYRWINSDGYTPFWGELASKFGFDSGEQLRRSFRHECERRGVSKTNNVKLGPKAVVFDIESLPIRALVWKVWDENVYPEQVLQGSCVLSWTGKTLNSSRVYGDILTSREAKEHDDENIVKSAWGYLNGKDIIIGHNLKRYDMKELNTRFIYYGLQPLSQYQTIDTYLVAKQNFAFERNSLKYINSYLGIRQKIENEGFSLWKRCDAGDVSALKEMYDYNIGDIFATEELYYKLRPFIKNHPNLALWYPDIEELMCSNCGSTNLIENGFALGNKYQSYRCECGAICRSTKDLLSKEKRSKLTRSI